MGDYEPRGSTDDYGHRGAPREQPPPGEHEEPHAGPREDPLDPSADAPPRSAPGASSLEGTVEVGDDSSVPSKDERQMAMFAHLGGLIGWYFTGGVFSFVVPLAIWLAKKDGSPFLDDQGREALNFQLTALIFAFFLGFLGILSIVTAGLALCLLIPLALAYGVYVLVFGIIASIKANEGVRYRYPFNLRML